MVRTAAQAPATEKQIAFASKLLREKGSTSLTGMNAERALDVLAGRDIDKREASDLIDALLKAPKRVAATAAEIVAYSPTPTVTEIGVYKNADGEVFLVKPNQEKTRLYAKKLVEINAQRATEAGTRVEIEFEYDPGAIFRLTPDMKMPLDEGKALTVRYGKCFVCGRHLKAAASVERGIGPVCQKYFS